MRGLSTCMLALCAALAMPAIARAGSINLCGGAAGWTASWDNALDGLVQIIAADCSQLANGRVFIEKSAEFTQPPVNGVFQSVNIVFTQTAITNVIRLIIEDEVITNSTGQPWTGFNMVLTGPAVFDPAATAVSGGPAPIGFSIAPFTTAAFSNGNSRLDIGGGVVTNGAQWFPGGGVSDGELHIVATPNPGAPFATFTLTETPVPEPSALTLLAFGAVTLFRRRSR